MNKKVGLILAIAACTLLVYVMAKGFGNDPHAVPFMMAKKPAPPFHLTNLQTGEPVNLTDFKGKPVLLNFWATWCGPCKMEHPVIEAGARRYGSRVAFLGIVFEDNEENTRRFLAENGWSITQLFDPKSTVAVDYAVAGVPETYFITKDQVIEEKYIQPIDRITLAAKLSKIVDDPVINETVKQALERLKDTKNKELATLENRELFVRGFAMEGRSVEDIVQMAEMPQ